MSLLNRVSVDNIADAIHYYCHFFELQLTWRGVQEAVLVSSDVCLIVKQKSRATEMDGLLSKHIQHSFHVASDYWRVLQQVKLVAVQLIVETHSDSECSCLVQDKFGLQWSLNWSKATLSEVA